MQTLMKRRDYDLKKKREEMEERRRETEEKERKTFFSSLRWRKCLPLRCDGRCKGGGG
jgi:hypothetical protein